MTTLNFLCTSLLSKVVSVQHKQDKVIRKLKDTSHAMIYRKYLNVGKIFTNVTRLNTFIST